MSQSFQNVCVILLVNILFYWKTIYFDYISDDIPSSQRNHPENPFVWALWVLEGRLKYKKDVDHAITLLLHALVGVGIYLGFGANNVSFVAALLFGFNPINNQGAVWISGRGYVLSALGMVWALALPMEMGGLMLLGATYSNAGFFMPLALIGSNHPYLLVFMPLVWMFHVENFRKNVNNKIKIEMFEEDKLVHPKKLILATKTFGFYLSHSLIPFKTTFYHSLLESIAGANVKKAYTLCRYFWFGAVSIVIMVGYVCTHKWDMVCFGMLWWCVGISPFLNLFRMQQEIAERYAYLPNIGLMFVVAQLISSNPYLVAGLVMMYATKTFFYIDGYKEDFILTEFSRVNSLDSWFGWHIGAMKRFEKQSFQEALLFWMEALKISPNEFKVLYNIAVTLKSCGQPKEAEKYIEMAAKSIPQGQEKAIEMILWNFKRGQLTVLI